MPHFENNYATRGAPILSPNVIRDWSDRGHLDWTHFTLIRRLWKGTLVVKGILDAEDARIARDAGADGIIVSNHGGRQLDGAVSPLRVLPGIVAACPDIPVMMDSGVRRGTDVLKALALGGESRHRSHVRRDCARHGHAGDRAPGGSQSPAAVASQRSRAVTGRTELCEVRDAPPTPIAVR